MNDRVFIKNTFYSRLIPVILSVLLVQLCSIANNLIIGNRIGSSGLAVMSAVNPVYFVFATLGALLAVGGACRTALLIGKNDSNAVNRAFSMSFVSVLIAGAALSVVGIICIKPLMEVLNVPLELRETAQAYLTGYIPAACAVMGIYIPFNYLKLIGRQNLSVLLFMGMAVLNISLDLLFVDALNMGMLGIGIATSISLWATFIAGMFALTRGKGDFKFVKLVGARTDFINILKLGSPSAANNLCNVLRVYFMNLIIVSSMGSSGLSVFGLIATVTSFSIAISSGTAMCMAPFAGVFAGERDNVSLRRIFKYAIFGGCALMAVYAITVFIGAEGVCGIFSITDAELVAECSHALRMFALSLIPATINFIVIGFHQSNKHTLIANILTASRAFAAVVLAALAITRLVGVYYIWLSFLAAELITLLINICCTFVYSKRHRYTSRFLLIDTFAEENGQFIAFSVAADNNEAAKSAERITDFCKQNNLSPKKTMAIGLAIEEILVSLNEHALNVKQKNKQGKLLTADVRVMIINDTIILRFRCGGKRFDPVAAAEKDDELLSGSMGIKLIQKLAVSVTYNHTFGVNNLTIVL